MGIGGLDVAATPISNATQFWVYSFLTIFFVNIRKSALDF
jgi:hypothetical protein